LKIQKLTEHYQQLLGFSAIWKVDDVNLSVSGLKIDVHLRFVGDEVFCPQCGDRSKAYDKAPEQSWRHLDTMQFETIIIARIPRCQCETCGVKTIAIPWAAPNSRFNLLFEGFSVALLQHYSSVQAASNILSLDWHAVNQIMKRAVEQGLLRWEPDNVVHVGMDEKSFRTGHKHITILNHLAVCRTNEKEAGRKKCLGPHFYVHFRDRKPYQPHIRPKQPQLAALYS
jgi:transposase